MFLLSAMITSLFFVTQQPHGRDTSPSSWPSKQKLKAANNNNYNYSITSRIVKLVFNLTRCECWLDWDVSVTTWNALTRDLCSSWFHNRRVSFSCSDMRWIHISDRICSFVVWIPKHLLSIVWRIHDAVSLLTVQQRRRRGWRRQLWQRLWPIRRTYILLEIADVISTVDYNFALISQFL